MAADELIDFLIIGAGKSGTTSIYYYLSQHPQIHMSPVKEPGFFLLPGLDIETTLAERQEFEINNPGRIETLKDYRRLFRDAKPGQLRGEASIHYLSSEVAAQNIARYTPSARLICVVRNPIERALSNHAHALRDHLEKRNSILDVLEQDGVGHVYFQGGFYGRELQRFAQCAPANPLRVWLYDDLARDAVGLIKELLRFLDVDDTFNPDTSFRANVSGRPTNVWAKAYDWAGRSKLRKNRAVRRFVSAQVRQRIVKALAAKGNASRSRPQITPNEWAALRELYESDLRVLEEFLGADLSHWRTPPQ